MCSALRILILPVLLLALDGSPASGQAAQRQFGIQVGHALAGSPMGSVAESFGTFAIPGREYELRLLTRSARGNEWSIGLIADEYSMDHQLDAQTRSSFDYESIGIMAGRAWSREGAVVSAVWGVDAGWRHFRVHSSRPDFHTGELAESRTRGGSGFAGVMFGLELPGWYGVLQPRARLEGSFPSFGGGDGFSAVHRTSDMGLRASIGINLRAILIGRGRTEPAPRR